MEASEPKWVNFTINIIGVNSLRIGGLEIRLHIKIMRFICHINSETLYGGLQGRLKLQTKKIL